MLDVDFRVGPNMILSREPSAEMQTIRQLRDIYKEDHEGLCENAPRNMIGALLLWEMRAEIEEEMQNRSLFNPLTLTEPIEVVKRVPLSFFRNFQGVRSQTPIGIDADSVLVKRGCGVVAGIVLEGPLTGLFVLPQTEHSIDFSKGMNIRRVWNDQPSDNGTPYHPKYPVEQELKGFLNRHGEIILMKRDKYESVSMNYHLMRMLKTGYNNEVAAARDQLGREPYDTDLLFRLCQRSGIAVDQEAFHFTRAI